MYISDKLWIKGTEQGKSLHTLADVIKDEVLFEFEQRFLDHPTRTSLQIEENKHQESTNPDALENFLNHSCNPNGYINFEDLTYRAMRDIEDGEEITFDYLTTEYELSNPFKCECGSENCRGQIKGFKYLPLDEKRKLEPYLSPYLKKKLEEEMKK